MIQITQLLSSAMSTVFTASFIMVVTGIITYLLAWRWRKINEHKSRFRNHLSRKHEDVEAGIPIIVCEHVDEYRKAVGKHVNAGDNVLEVGCHRGTTTGIIKTAAKSGKVVGIDSSEFQLGFAKEKYKNIEFICDDGCDVRNIVKLGIKWGVIFIDISGSRDLKTLIPLITSYEKALKPRMIVVKSIKYTKLLHQSVLFVTEM